MNAFIHTTSSDLLQASKTDPEVTFDENSELAKALNLAEINSKERTSSSLTYRYAVKPWLQAKLVPLGVHLAIERSDAKKIVFRCRHKTEVDASTHPGGPKIYCSCPFKLRANHLKKYNKWNISIVNEKHNHELVPRAAPSAPISTPSQNSTPQTSAYGQDPFNQMYLSLMQAAAAAANLMDLNRLILFQEPHSLISDKELEFKTNELVRLSHSVVMDKVVADRGGLSNEKKLRILNELVDELGSLLRAENVIQ